MKGFRIFRDPEADWPRLLLVLGVTLAAGGALNVIGALRALAN